MLGSMWPQRRGFTHQRKLIMKTITAFLAISLLAVLTGCNTVEGAGKDVKATGAAVEKAADNSKPK